MSLRSAAEKRAEGGPLRIALITPGFSADESDWCIPGLLHLVRELARWHQVEILALRYPTPSRRYLVHGASVRTLGGGQRVGAVSRALLLVRAMAALARLRRSPPDVVHGMWADEAGFLAVLAGRLLRRPAVVSLLGGELTELAEIGYGHQLYRVPRWLVGRALAHADRVTVGSRAFEAAARPRIEGDRLSVMPWGVDTTLFAAEGPSLPVAGIEGAPALLNVASLTPVKDQALLLHAMSALTEPLPGARLHLVGSGPERGRLESLGAALGVADRVFFHGEVRHERLAAFYRGADLFLLSSRYESQCMAVLEAAACGTPTVGVGVGILPDLEPAALALSHRDPQRMADAVHSLVSSPGELEAMRRAGLEQIESRFALSRTVARLVELYRSLAASTANKE